MVTVAEVTDPLRTILTPVPPLAFGICGVCHRSTNGTFDRCYSCGRTTEQVSRPALRITPLSFYETGDQLWHNLRNYKDSPDPQVRAQLTLNVVALLARFINEHRACIAPQGWDHIVGVPSTRNTDTTHPLVTAMRRVPSLRDDVSELLDPGTARIGHQQADDHGYRASPPGSSRVLLVDDTLTSGARLQSAASALSLGGYTVTGAVVVGRVYDRSFGERAQPLWDLASKRAFDFARCCWCDTDWPALT